jgi:hypothetical protein
MPDAHQLGPGTAKQCARCGEPLGGGPWWNLDGTPIHERCAHWASRAFPLHGDVRRLRSRRRKLARALAAVDATLRFFERAERHWPRDASAVLERARRWTARLEARLRELGVSGR